MNRRAFRVGAAWATAATLALGLASAAHAEKKPEDPVEKRFQGIEKQIKQLREIVLQARDTGQPVQVRVSTDPDPTLDALTMRLDDLEQAAKTRNEQIDSLTHDLETARKTDADGRAEIKALEDRLTGAEAKIKALSDAAQQAAAAATAQTAAAGPPPPGGPAPDAAATEAQAGEAFKQADQLMHEGDYAAASTAFAGVVQTYGDTSFGPAARYWLGKTLFAQGRYTDAAAAYIGAIRGWPQTSWAPDAMLELSRTLIAMNKPADACHTIAELGRRYPMAPPAAKAKARDIRAAAKCVA